MDRKIGGVIVRKVAIENNLQDVKDYLKDKGYSVESLEDKRQDLDTFDAIVVTGQNSNFLGIEDSSTKKSIISADGRTPSEIHNEIERRMI